MSARCSRVMRHRTSSTRSTRRVEWWRPGAAAVISHVNVGAERPAVPAALNGQAVIGRRLGLGTWLDAALGIPTEADPSMEAPGAIRSDRVEPVDADRHDSGAVDVDE